MGRSNPAYSVFDNLIILDRPTEATMTVEGAVTKTSALVTLAAATAILTFASRAGIFILPSLIVSTVVAFAIIFRPRLAPILAPAYAIAEGAGLGIFSAHFEDQYPGIALHAITGTLGTLGVMLLLYRAKVITYSAKFAGILASITIGIGLIYVVDLIMAYFSMSVGFVRESTPIGIAFSMGVVVVAALNFIGDFDMIERGAEERAPKYMEWYCAFGILLTVVWLYLEILRLLAKLSNRNNR